MSDNNQFDLNAELSEAKSAFLNNVETAAEEVKQQLKAAADSERKKAQEARSKRLSRILMVVGAVVVLLVCYWAVFARPDANSSAAKSQNRTAVKVQVTDPAASTAKPRATTTPTAPARPVGDDSQVVEHPSDEYEQPGGNSGM